MQYLNQRVLLSKCLTTIKHLIKGRFKTMITACYIVAKIVDAKPSSTKQLPDARRLPPRGPGTVAEASHLTRRPPAELHAEGADNTTLPKFA